MRARRLPDDVGAHHSLSTVTVVESNSCHFCEDARQVLTEVAARFPLELQVVDVRSRQGCALMNEAVAGQAGVQALAEGAVLVAHGAVAEREWGRDPVERHVVELGTG